MPNLLTMKMVLFVSGLGIALFALIGLNRWFQNLRWGRGGNKRIQIQDTQVLDEKSRLHIVKIDEREFVILAGQQGSHMIALEQPHQETKREFRRTPLLREVSGE